MNSHKYFPFFILLFGVLLSFLLAACQAVPPPEISFPPASLRLSGERVFDLESDFVTRFPNRHSGQPNNRLAAEWLLQQYSNLGWNCRLDEWQIVNYSRPVTLNNVVCSLPSDSQREMLVVAHHDQASTTVQGADNDGSGVAILLHLAEIFAAESPLPYTLVFVSTDAEEYGMIGSGRYIQTHPDPRNIIAGLSLDNLGRTYYDAMNMEQIGQYRRFGPLWLALAAREAARSANLWEVHLTSLVDQITGQAAPVSFMDQGPIVAAGVPALGFAGHVPAQSAYEHFRLWHDPDDTLDRQSAATLGQSGRTVEALLRQLLSMNSFPEESGPYLYFDGSRQVLRGLPLWLIFIAFVAIFFLGGLSIGKTSLQEKWLALRTAVPHFLGLWLPLLASILLLYLFVAVGLMLAFYRYPATTKDPYLLSPRWPAVALYLLGLGLFLFLGRWLTGRFAGRLPRPAFGALKSFALLVVGLGGVYVIFLNPFSLLFFLPLLFWFLIGGRQGLGKALDILFFVLGGLVVYGLIYFFGFLTLRSDFAFLWYLMNMFSTRMISFPSAVVITAIIGAGLAMVVNPPARKLDSGGR